MEWLSDPQIWISLMTLIALEVVLGIDNLVFLSILANRLPAHQQDRARKIGLSLALIMRLALLATISWIVGLTGKVFGLFGHDFSWRDMILIAGGLFLVYKATREIHERIEGHAEIPGAAAVASVTLGGVIFQIILMDIIFSLDSVITAVGMVDELWIMVTAVIVAVIVMVIASRPLAEFINRHPTVKMLALSFLMLVGMVLIADGFGFHVPKGYIYGAMGFSIAVEALNLMEAKRRARQRDRVKGVEPG
ncbi:MAG TPA: TerC family protein [Alphaproteobacteria bacterium]